MTIRSILSGSAGLMGLTLIHIIAVIIAGVAFGITEPASTDLAEQQNAFGLFVLMCTINSITLFTLAKYSSWTGKRLSLGIFIIYFGIAPFMSLIEAVFFLSSPTPTVALSLMAMQGFSILLVALVVPFSTGKRKVSDESLLSTRLASSAALLRTASLIAVAYLVIYWVFGYYVAWQDADLRAFYGGNELVPFFDHLINSIQQGPGIFLFQLFRGVLWAGLAYVIYRMVNKGPFATMILTGLCFSLLMATGLLLPNEYMPENVRSVHMIEVLSSNAVFGMLAAWLWIKSEKVVEV